ncbi:MAG: hypothetical protein NVSMB65_01990 [Chloroflexota bacterium]
MTTVDLVRHSGTPSLARVRSVRITRRGRRGGILLLLVLAAVLAAGPAAAHVKTVLLVAQVMPQIPLKPLDGLTNAPRHTRAALSSAAGPLVLDLFAPVPRFGGVAARSQPAVLLAMGVKISPHDRPIILGFARTLSRLGYVVLWPRLKTLDDGRSLPETPQTFVAGVRYLTRLPSVDRRRISIIGFSVGGSLALVAATDPRIARDVHALVFFGGYYDIADYLVSLATHSSALGTTHLTWQPDRQATGHVTELLRAEHATGLLRLFTARTAPQARAILRAATPREQAFLRAVNPATHLARLHARLFILHDRGDPFVPYLESAKLYQATAARPGTRYLSTNLFRHTEPKAGTPLPLGDALALYGFVHAVLDDF